MAGEQQQDRQVQPRVRRRLLLARDAVQRPCRGPRDRALEDLTLSLALCLERVDELIARDLQLHVPVPRVEQHEPLEPVGTIRRQLDSDRPSPGVAHEDEALERHGLEHEVGEP